MSRWEEQIAEGLLLWGSESESLGQSLGLEGSPRADCIFCSSMRCLGHFVEALRAAGPPFAFHSHQFRTSVGLALGETHGSVRGRGSAGSTAVVSYARAEREAQDGQNCLSKLEILPCHILHRSNNFDTTTATPMGSALCEHVSFPRGPAPGLP